MRKNATRMTAVLGAVALTTSLAAPALASPGGNGTGGRGSGQQTAASQGIGVGRLAGLDLSWEQMTAVHRALVEARSTAQMTDRSAAIASLLAAGTIDAAQAKALAGATGRSAMRALLASGAVTIVQIKALKNAMRTAAAADRAAASLAALNTLAAAGTITGAQVTAIMDRLAMTGASRPAEPTTQAPGTQAPGTQVQGTQLPGYGRGEGAGHGNSGHQGLGPMSGSVGDDDDRGGDESDDMNEAEIRTAAAS
jgi:Spy/CpxP family protein refolding chaperone